MFKVNSALTVMPPSTRVNVCNVCINVNSLREAGRKRGREAKHRHQLTHVCCASLYPAGALTATSLTVPSGLWCRIAFPSDIPLYDKSKSPTLRKTLVASWTTEGTGTRIHSNEMNEFRP